MGTWEEYKKKNEEKFINDAANKFGNKFDLSNVKYISSKMDVSIICPIHGEFSIPPQSFLRSSYGCPKCGKKAGAAIRAPKQIMCTDDFKEKAIVVHGEKYDYSKTDLEHKREDGKICIICPIHGEFWQRPNNHLQGDGCKECAKISRHNLQIKELETFIEEARKVHGDKYDYSQSVYKGTNDDICIICPIHGEFLQPPHNHLRGHGCPTCNASKLELAVINELAKNDIAFEMHVRKNKLSWLGRLTLDIYIPTLNMAIECQGGQHFKVIEHFGGEEELAKRIENDSRKRELCKANEVKLIYFLEEEYNKFLDGSNLYFNDVNKLIEYIKNS